MITDSKRISVQKIAEDMEDNGYCEAGTLLRQLHCAW